MPEISVAELKKPEKFFDQVPFLKIYSIKYIAIMLAVQVDLRVEYKAIVQTDKFG